jgi:glutathione S-transferase
MSTEAPTLYQFPISHYCEKARWSLDAKGVSYRLKNVIPGIHILVLKRIAGTRTVPVLVDGPTTITDSTAIAVYLDRTYPGPRLVPEGEAERARALELDGYFNRMAGESVRRWLYGELLKEGSGNAAAAMFAAYPAPVRAIGKLLAPRIEKELRRMYRINEDSVDQGRKDVLEAAQRLEDETGGDPARYLVGSSMTLADITAASTLAAIVSPPESPYASEPGSISRAVAEVRRSIRERPAGKWVMERYRRDRPSARS